MPLWDSIKAGAKKAGDAAALQAKKAKLKADILMVDRDIINRQRAFGVAMYDHVAPLSQSTDFYAADDPLTSIIRPALINAQKEIQALAAKKVKLKEQLASAEAQRAAAFPTKAETAGQKITNFGKASYMHGGETKIKTELAVVERKIKGHKQEFGIELFARLVEKEDQDGWLPTDRQVRNMYDTCRGDIQRLENTKKTKREEIISLGGSVSDPATTTPSTTTTATESSSTNGFVPPQQPVMTSAATTTSAPTSNSSFAPPPASAFSDNPPPPASSSGASGGFSSFSDVPQQQQSSDGPVDLLL